MDSSLSSRHCRMRSLWAWTLFGWVLSIFDIAIKPRYFTKQQRQHPSKFNEDNQSRLYYGIYGHRWDNQTRLYYRIDGHWRDNQSRLYYGIHGHQRDNQSRWYYRIDGHWRDNQLRLYYRIDEHWHCCESNEIIRFILFNDGVSKTRLTVLVRVFN